MIALVNLQASRRVAGCEELVELPRGPALRWSAFLIRTTRDLRLVEVVPWAAEVRSRRPFVPIGLVRAVDPDEAALFGALAETGMEFEPILEPEELPAGLVRKEHLVRLREHTVEGIVLELWRRERGIHDGSLLALLRAIIAHGIQGGLAQTLNAAARDGRPLSESTVRRRLKKADLPTLASLLRDARLRSVHVRLQLGTDKRDAVRAAGFSSAKVFEKALRRSG